MPRTGLDNMRELVRAVCLATNYPGLMALITTLYPSVATAINALVAACNATNFDKVPEIEP